MVRVAEGSWEGVNTQGESIWKFQTEESDSKCDNSTLCNSMNVSEIFITVVKD